MCPGGDVDVESGEGGQDGGQEVGLGREDEGVEGSVFRVGREFVQAGEGRRWGVGVVVEVLLDQSREGGRGGLVVIRVVRRVVRVRVRVVGRRGGGRQRGYGRVG